MENIFIPKIHDQVVRILDHHGAIIKNGHFAPNLFMHCDSFVNMATLSQYPLVFDQLAEMTAQNFVDDGIEIVVGPALGGIIYAYELAKRLTKMTGRTVLAAHTEEMIQHNKRVFILRRGFDTAVAGKRALIVDDLTIRGGAAADAKLETIKHGGIPVGIAVICKRGNASAETLKVDKFLCLCDLPVQSWSPGPWKSEDPIPEDTCPMCIQRMDINTTFGRGHYFVERFGQPATWNQQI